ncbi:cytochrome P450 [Cadophora sp. MPI-SDFR-AT-0126]|nr:cytochrome P450 [Leotiomycetes sp. MPI-SDFR-AT-0126]
MPQFESFQNLSLGTIAPLLASIGLVWVIVYRCFFHPLAAIPGPFWAKLSKLWLLQHDFSWKGSESLHKLHQKYGPIVRIAPNEVSYDDLAAYSDLYGQKSRFLKEEAWYYGIIPASLISMFTTCDAELHSILRRLFSHAFSRTSVIGFQDKINEHINIALESVSALSAEGQPVRTYDMAASFTLDTISRLCFGNSVKALSRPTFDHPLIDSLDGLLFEPLVLMRIHYPAFCYIPRRGNFSHQAELLRVISGCLDELEVHDKDVGEFSLIQDASRRAKELGFDLDKQKKTSILFQFVGAGFGTTAMTIAGILQHLMRNPEMYKRLQAELTALSPNKIEMMTVYQIENLPYFEACIKEGIRVVCASPLRMPKVAPEEGYKFGGYHVPAGTTVSSSNYFRCYDEKFYPEPFRFIPERWMTEESKALNASWLPFAKGNRSCIGQHMSMVETKLFVAHFVRRFEPVVLVDDFITKERLVLQPANPMRVLLREV